jgi:hypothetical protein
MRRCWDADPRKTQPYRVVLILLLAVGVSACGGSSDSVAGSGAPSAPAPSTPVSGSPVGSPMATGNATACTTARGTVERLGATFTAFEKQEITVVALRSALHQGAQALGAAAGAAAGTVRTQLQKTAADLEQARAAFGRNDIGAASKQLDQAGQDFDALDVACKGIGH